MTAKAGKIKKLLMILVSIGIIYTIIIAVRSYDYYQKNSLPTYTNVAENKTNGFDLYPFDLDFCTDKCKNLVVDFVTLDENNVYMVDYSKIKNLRGKDGLFYTPITIGLISLVHHTRFLRYKDQADYDLFISNVNWLRDNTNPDGCWLYSYDIMLSKAPWCSGMSQGLGISALIRAYRMTFCRVLIHNSSEHRAIYSQVCVFDL